MQSRRVPPAPSQKTLSEDDAVFGAAYRVIFERIGSPYNCKTGDQLVLVSTKIADIRKWSRTLDAELARAYERAAVAVLEEARKMVENTLRGQRMLAIYATIPKPPEPERKDEAA